MVELKRLIDIFTEAANRAKQARYDDSVRLEVSLSIAELRVIATALEHEWRSALGAGHP